MTKRKQARRDALIVEMYWHGLPVLHIGAYWGLTDNEVYSVLAVFFTAL